MTIMNGDVDFAVGIGDRRSLLGKPDREKVPMPYTAKTFNVP